ncbi:hypothetical protein C8R43DRAFT_946894 [Mycena crocata]|nr:hypothetical protein C8R43DRAFT_946894 [Mycena crocata]
MPRGEDRTGYAHVVADQSFGSFVVREVASMIDAGLRREGRGTADAVDGADRTPRRGAPSTSAQPRHGPSLAPQTHLALAPQTQPAVVSPRDAASTHCGCEHRPHPTHPRLQAHRHPVAQVIHVLSVDPRRMITNTHKHRARFPSLTGAPAQGLHTDIQPPAHPPRTVFARPRSSTTSTPASIRKEDAKPGRMASAQNARGTTDEKESKVGDHHHRIFDSADEDRWGIRYAECEERKERK